MVSNRYTNIKVGIITFLGFILLIALFTWKSGSLMRFSGYNVIGQFDNVSGLLETADVRYRGYSVGKVLSMVTDHDSIKVVVRVRNSVKIPLDSKFRIAFDGLIGQKYLSILPGTSPFFLNERDVIPGIAAAGIVDFIDEVARSMVEVQGALVDLRNIVADPEFQGGLKRSVVNIDKGTREISVFGSNLNHTVKELDLVIANLKQLTSESKQEQLEVLLDEYTISAKNLNLVLGDVAEITSSTANKRNIELILDNVQVITEKLKQEGIKVRMF